MFAFCLCPPHHPTRHATIEHTNESMDQLEARLPLERALTAPGRKKHERVRTEDT